MGKYYSVFTIEELNKRWQQKNPTGCIWQDTNKSNTYCVVYKSESKVYDYKCSNLYQLAEKLKLTTEEENLIKQNKVKLTCGCIFHKSNLSDKFYCENCFTVLRQPKESEIITEDIFFGGYQKAIIANNKVKFESIN